MFLSIALSKVALGNFILCVKEKVDSVEKHCQGAELLLHFWEL